LEIVQLGLTLRRIPLPITITITITLANSSKFYCKPDSLPPLYGEKFRKLDLFKSKFGLGLEDQITRHLRKIKKTRILK